ncbi:MAG TPA: hypothetical protein VKQ72_22600 [Aggregatilineales bacterium]|nr:hypothetical protein [Aggregatilineales bacterium]
MGNEDVQNLLKSGIAAAKARNKGEARRLLEQVLELDDSNEAAWMWLASVVDTPREKRICLENVIELNPDNVRAREALAQLGPAPQSAAPVTPTQASAPTGAQPALRSAAATNQARAARSGPPETAPARGSRPSPLARSIQRNPVLFLGGGGLAILLILVGVVLAFNQSAPPAVAQNTVAAPTARANAPTARPQGTIVTLPAVVFPTTTPALTSTPFPTFTPSPTLTPLNTYKLVFTGEGRNTTNQSDLYTISADGTGERPLLTESSKAFFSPAVSNNGQLAYVSVAEDKEQVFVGDLSGNGGKAITKFNGEHLSGVNWSSDNSKIAFAASASNDDPTTREIYVINADGSGQQQITNNKVEDSDPAWSPDGKSLVYAEDVSQGQHFLQLTQYDLASKSAQTLTNFSGANYNPAWSPDGKKIAFVSTKDGFPNVYYISLSDPFTANLVSVGGERSNNTTPAWSPDGTYIAFASNRDGNALDLYIATPDGLFMKKLTNSSNAKDNSYGAHFIPAAK